MLLHGLCELSSYEQRIMIAALSVIGVLVGTASAYMAGRLRRHQQVMEIFGGVLLIAGFALLGYSLESIFGPPLPPVYD
jgi:hypothetical protein